MIKRATLMLVLLLVIANLIGCAEEDAEPKAEVEVSIGEINIKVPEDWNNYSKEEGAYSYNNADNSSAVSVAINSTNKYSESSEEDVVGQIENSYRELTANVGNSFIVKEVSDVEVNGIRCTIVYAEITPSDRPSRLKLLIAYYPDSGVVLTCGVGMIEEGVYAYGSPEEVQAKYDKIMGQFRDIIFSARKV